MFPALFCLLWALLPEINAFDFDLIWFNDVPDSVHYVDTTVGTPRRKSSKIKTAQVENETETDQANN